MDLSVPAFSKRKSKANIRKRSADAEDEAAEAGGPVAAASEGPSVVRKAAKVQKEDPLVFSTKGTANRLETFKYESNGALQQQTDQGATATLETETQHDRDARAIREAILRQGGEDGAVEGEQGYQGMKGYVDYRKGFRREHTIGAEKGSGAHGPLRGTVHIRTTARFDYQPDICKDYKETGFCGYGDACKFIHDRSDYKSGWELDREWDQKQKQLADKKVNDWDPDAAEAAAGSEEEDDELPFACYICRKPWAETTEPVVTRCKHYFCETCALKHNAKSSKCAVCEQPTNGLFNIATDVIKRQKQKNVAA